MSDYKVEYKDYTKGRMVRTAYQARTSLGTSLPLVASKLYRV